MSSKRAAAAAAAAAITSNPTKSNNNEVNRSNNNEAPDKRKEIHQKIVTAPYQLAARSAAFKLQYKGNIGYTVEATKTENVRLRMRTAPLRRTIASLGFTKVEEEMADCIIPDENMLNWTILTSKGSKVARGPSYITMKPFVERMYLMCNKWLLVKSLRQVEDRLRKQQKIFRTGSGRVFSHIDFIPFTLSMSSKSLEADLGDLPGAYLAKPVRGSMGQRMQLVRIRPGRVKEDLLNFLVSSEFIRMRQSQVILQRYIEKPLLIDKRKFDMRVYMLVVNPKRGDGSTAKPLESGYFAFHHPGFVRLSSVPYDPNHSDIAVHLTNQSIQARHTNTFRRLKEVTTWYPDELNDYLNKRNRMHCQDWAKDVMYPKIGAILGYIAEVFRHNLDDHDCSTSTFRVLGVDMLVDEKLKVYLLEFNELPAWGHQTTVLYSIKPNLWRETICLVSEVAIRYKNYLPIAEQHFITRQNFHFIYSSLDPELARRNIARLY